MTWIQVIPPARAEGELQQAYQAIYPLYPPEYCEDLPALQNQDGSADSVVAAHSLIPRALHHGLATLGVLLSPDLPLSRRQHEMIATVVSALNGCFY